MPLVYQQNINVTTKIALWHIAEPEIFFLESVPLQRNISHWHKRLQHLAGRYLLKQMFIDFPVELIEIADTRKPFLANDPYHFSISHCGDYAAAIASTTHRVGVDVELLNDKIEQIQHKFISKPEVEALKIQCPMKEVQCLTLYWSIKESVFKWWGRGAVDFKKDIQIKSISGTAHMGFVQCTFKELYELELSYVFYDQHFLTWVITDH